VIEIEFVIVLSGAAGLAVTVVARRLPVRATTGLVAAFSGLNTAAA
jgi:hypothetical protein